MVKEILTPEDAAQLVQQAGLVNRAWVANEAAQRPFSVQIQTLDLSTARLSTDPYKLNGQFRSMYIQDATDVLVNIQVLLGSRDTTQSAFTMKKNDSFSMERPVNEAYLYWSAQDSKTVTFVTFTDVEFKSGSQISVTGGGVTLVDGSTITGPTRVTLAATTATIIAPALANRKKCTIQNKTGADLYIGGSTIGAVGGANEGLKVAPDSMIYWQNTGALYGWSVAGGNISYVEEQ